MSAQPDTIHSSGKIASLDGIRGAAILMVLISHCLAQPLSVAAIVPGTWQYSVWSATKLFYTGVDLFFILSGFLICKVVLDNLQSKNLFQVFYIRRGCRIAPLYFLAVALTFTAAHLMQRGELWNWMFEKQHPLWSYLTLTQNFLMGKTGNPGGNALAVTWSLAIEEQFYLVLPLSLRLLPNRLLPWLFAAAFPMAYFVRMIWHDARSYTWAPARADALLLGCLLAWIVRQPGAMDWLRKQTSGLYALAALLFAGLLYINRMPEYFGEATHSWLAAFYGILTLIAVTQRQSPVTRFFEMRWLGFLGTISYGLYLLHRPVQAAVHYWVQGGLPKISSASELWLFPVVLGLSVIAASASYYFFEKFFLNLGRRVRFE